MAKVFVYGTLKSGGELRGLDRFGDGATIVGKAKTVYPDYEMADLGAFPGVFLNGEYHIEGEVWEVDDDTMEDLDAIEGYPDFYNRQLTHTTEGKAWMYYLAGDTYKSYKGERGNQVVEDGDTLRWQR
jgi:gamma-glutamylcyclotransferase (GGCT)/AIG2-like uncharacterized protein YtfP